MSSAINTFKSIVHNWRLISGCVLWLVAMFSLATAAEGINKNEWILIGSIPITLLALGFVVPHHRRHKAVAQTKDTTSVVIAS